MDLWDGKHLGTEVVPCVVLLWNTHNHLYRNACVGDGTSHFADTFERIPRQPHNSIITRGTEVVELCYENATICIIKTKKRKRFTRQHAFQVTYATHVDMDLGRGMVFPRFMHCLAKTSQMLDSIPSVNLFIMYATSSLLLVLPLHSSGNRVSEACSWSPMHITFLFYVTGIA